MKIMVLGGGSNQLDLIKKIKQQGDEVILIDYLTDCPGKKYADIHLLTSTFDVDGIILAAKKYAVDGIVTSGTDQPVLSAAVASEAVGLNFYIDANTALNVTNKQHMKKLFVDNNIPTVNYKLVKQDFDEAELAGITFPVVMKPIDCQGQRGVYKLDSIDDIRKNIGNTLSFSRQDVALIEEYYKNDEITVNGWVTNGEITILSVVDRVTINRDEHIGICLCHNFPSVHLQKYYDDINKITGKIVSAFGIKNGPIYFQYLIGEQGVKVNEIAMRIGGAYEGITIPIISGVDILQMVLDYVILGECRQEIPKNYNLRNPQVFLSTQLYFCNPGEIKYMTPVSELEKLIGVVTAYQEYKIGDRLPDIENATARAGYMIIKGNSFSNMIDNINNVFDNYSILDTKGNNLLIKYSDYKDKYSFYKEI